MTTSDEQGRRAPQYIWQWLMLEKSLMVGALLAAALGCVVELVPYYLLWRGADAILTGVDVVSTLQGIALWWLAAIFCKYIALALSGFLSHKAAFRILFEIRRILVGRIQALPVVNLHQYSSANLKKMLVNDVERVENFVAHHTPDIIAAITSPLVASAFLFWLDWRMALCALLPIPLAILCQMVLQKGSDSRMAEYLESVEELNRAVTEYVKGIRVMKIYGRSGRSFAHLEQVIGRYHKLVNGYISLSIPSWSAFVVMLNANAYFILPVGLWLLIDGDISASTLLLFLVVGNGILRPMLKLTMFASLFKELHFCIERLIPLLETGSQSSTASPAKLTALPAEKPAYRLQGLSLAYGSHEILTDIDLSIKGGGLYGIVGLSGSGKSSLALVMAGLVEPSDGKVELFGANVYALADGERARTVTLVTQESVMFKGSLRLNLSLGDSSIVDDRLWDALAVVGLADHVKALPSKLDTQLAEFGTTFSGGERQRIALARAILTEPRVLILDEATAFADAVTEKKIYRRLQERYPSTVIIAIAHRMVAVKHSSAIILIDQGRIVGMASHEKLFKDNQLYADLWQSQFQIGKWHIKYQEA